LEGVLVSASTELIFFIAAPRCCVCIWD